MTIKARLSVAVAGVLLLATLVLGAVMVRSTRASLIDQIDDRLVASSTRLSVRESVLPPDAGALGEDRYRETAEIVVDRTGRVYVLATAGFPDAPDPLPAIPRGAEFEAIVDRVVTLPATAGDLDYRVLTTRLRGGGVRILATSLADVDDALADLVRTLVITAAAVVAAGAGASWWTIRRGLAPVDRMIGTAGQIAAGDLSHRVDHRDDGTELGRLAGALDEMLGRLEEAFAERAASEDRLRRFVGDASHELRTPVAAIRGYAELYRSGGLEDADALARAMHRIETESERMGRLVQDLLLLARLDQQRPLDLARVDVRDLVRDAADDLRAVDPDRPVTVEVAEEPAVVVGDDARLRQVVGNLVTNARLHTPAGTPVSLRVDFAAGSKGSEGRRQVVLTVADRGPGIPPEDRERIFERFYRADPSRTRATGGSGLGLSIVAAVVAAHGGAVAVEDEPAGGAAFVVRLPAAEPVDLDGSAGDAGNEAAATGGASGAGGAGGGAGAAEGAAAEPAAVPDRSGQRPGSPGGRRSATLHGAPEPPASEPPPA